MRRGVPLLPHGITDCDVTIAIILCYASISFDSHRRLWFADQIRTVDWPNPMAPVHYPFDLRWAWFLLFSHVFTSFPKNKRWTSFYDNSFFWSPFSPIQVVLDSKWGDLYNETISKSILRLSFSSDLQRICAIWHLLPLIWSLSELEVYPRSIFGSRLPTKRTFGIQKTDILIWTVNESDLSSSFILHPTLSLHSAFEPMFLTTSLYGWVGLPRKNCLPPCLPVELLLKWS